MKKILLAITIVSFCLSGYSQNSVKKGERGPFQTNAKAFDNTFIGLSGGVNFNFGDYDNGKSSPSLDIYFGKWWTPQVGARIGYSGIQLNGLTDNPSARYLQSIGSRDEKWNMNFIHTDLLWNICNAIQGYRSDRVWNVMPFIGFGVLNASGRNYDGLKANRWFIAGTVGIYNTFTVAKRVDITLEGRYSMSKNEYDGDLSQTCHNFDSFISVSAGIAFRIGKVGFEKHQTADYSSYENSISAYKDAIADATAKLAVSDAEIKALQDRLAAARDEETRLKSRNTGANCGILELFFNMNSSELDSKELGILDTYMKTAGKNLTFIVTGTADKATGNTAYNQTLSEKRAAYLAKILSEKYGIEHVVSQGAGEVETHTNPVINRTATIILK